VGRVPAVGVGESGADHDLLQGGAGIGQRQGDAAGRQHEQAGGPALELDHAGLAGGPDEAEHLGQGQVGQGTGEGGEWGHRR
jgi:hypothetical protein